MIDSLIISVLFSPVPQRGFTLERLARTENGEYQDTAENEAKSLFTNLFASQEWTINIAYHDIENLNRNNSK